MTESAHHRLTTADKNKAFDDLIASFTEDNWLEYLRKLGMSETDLPKKTGSYSDKHSVLNQWVMKIGILDEEKLRLMRQVREEVVSQSRMRDVERHLPSELAKSRDRAFLLYGIVQRYFGDDWDQKTKTSLEIPDHVLFNINSGHGSAQDKRYMMLVHWIQKKGYRTNIEIGQALKNLKFAVPVEYVDTDEVQPE